MATEKQLNPSIQKKLKRRELAKKFWIYFNSLLNHPWHEPSIRAFSELTPFDLPFSTFDFPLRKLRDFNVNDHNFGNLTRCSKFTPQTQSVHSHEWRENLTETAIITLRGLRTHAHPFFGSLILSYALQTYTLTWGGDRSANVLWTVPLVVLLLSQYNLNFHDTICFLPTWSPYWTIIICIVSRQLVKLELPYNSDGNMINSNTFYIC